MPEIAVIMGSKSDLISLKGAFDILNQFELNSAVTTCYQSMYVVTSLQIT